MSDSIFQNDQHAAELLGDKVDQPMSSNPTSTIDCGQGLIRKPIVVNDVILPIVKESGQTEVVSLEFREYTQARQAMFLLFKGNLKISLVSLFNLLIFII